MDAVEKATETQLQNIQKRSGKTLEQLFDIIRSSGLTRHSEIREMLKSELNMGYGDANALALTYLKTLEQDSKKSGDLSKEADALDEIYTGKNVSLRPIHEKLMVTLATFGPFETIPKKGYLSLRRKKQFAMIGPGSKSRLEVGINMKGVDETARLVAMPAGGMCQYKVWLSNPEDADDELFAWIRQAYDAAN